MSATISACGRYRYRLGRSIAALDVDASRVALFVMLNPSTADALKDDPTIKRCLHFARREGCGRLDVVNLYAFRSSSPDDLYATAEGFDPVGPENDATIAEAGRGAALIVVAWGNELPPAKRYPSRWLAPEFEERVRQVVNLLPDSLLCLGHTDGGWPKHPLARGKHRVPDGQPLAPWWAARNFRRAA